MPPAGRTVEGVEALVVMVDHRPRPELVTLEEVCATAALAGLLGVEWCRFDLVASGCGYVAHLRGPAEAVATIAASAPDGFRASVLEWPGPAT